jgi:hypothetical protein
MDFLRRLFGGKPANSAPAVPNTGAVAPVLPASATNTATIVGGKRRSRRRKQTRRNRKHSRKSQRK